MNKPSSWANKVAPQLPLFDRLYPTGTLGTLDNLTRSFNDKHYPEHMSESDRKSLLFYHLHEFAAAAPDFLKPQVLQLTAQLDELEAIQNKYRHQHAAGTNSPESDREAMQRSSKLAGYIHGSCVMLRGKAEEGITAKRLSKAIQADSTRQGIDTQFPCLSTLAMKAYQISLLQTLSSKLHDLHMITPQVNYSVKPKVHSTSALAAYELTETQRAIDAYYNAGGDLAARDLELHKRLQKHHEKPNFRNTEALSDELMALSKTAGLSNAQGQFHHELQSRLLRDYKFDRHDIRQRQANGTLTDTDPLQWRSALLDIAYLARWREVASKLGDVVYDKHNTIASPAIKGDPSSHVVNEIVKKAMVKVPTPQREL